MFDALSKLMTNLEFAVAGFFGAMVTLVIQRDAQNLKTAIAFLASGGAIGYYLTGLIAEFFTVSPAAAGGVGFLLGAFGVSLITAILKVISEGDLWAFIKNRFGGGA